MLSYTYYSVQPPHEQYGIELIVWGIALGVGLWEFVFHRAQSVPRLQ
jgi:hypothetical protein